MAFFSREYEVFLLLAAPDAAPLWNAAQWTRAAPLWQAAQWTRIELTPHLS